MSNNKFSSRNNIKKIKLDESEEIEEIITLQRKLNKTDISKNINISIDKSLDWLNFFFADDEIRTLYTNFERVRSLLILESIFYLNFYKNILNFKGKFTNTAHEKEENFNLNLNLINSNIKKSNEVYPNDQLPLIKFNNSVLCNNFNHNENLNEMNSNHEISQIHHLNEFVEVDNKLNDNRFFKNGFSPNKKFTNTDINFKSCRGLTYKDSIKNNNFNKTVNNYNFPNQQQLYVGIIGCGCVGEALTKYLIKIKDSNSINFKLIVSTRRPTKVDQDILNLVDENIEILLDNEKVFEECDLIYLCIQPHQLDLLMKEIYQPFNERLEKLRRKKNKIFPTVISMLSGITLEKLKNTFPDDTNIIRTTINHKVIAKYDEIYIPKSNVNENEKDNKFKSNKDMKKVEPNLRMRILGQKPENLQQSQMNYNRSELNASDLSLMKGGIFIPKDLTKYTEEAFDHILHDLEVFKKTLFGFHKAFNSNKSSINNNKNEFPMINVNQFLNINKPNNNSLSMSVTSPNFHRNSKPQNEELFSLTVFQILLGEQFESLFKTYDQNDFRSLNNLNEDIVKKIKENNSKIIYSIFKNAENY